MKNNLIILGPQGSGKGAQAEILTKKFDLAYFSMGDELRAISQESSSLAKKVKEKIEKGELIDDQTVMQVFLGWLKKHTYENFILDGMPRTLKQTEMLNRILDKDKLKPKVLFLNISKETAVKRLSTRKVCQSCNTIFGPFSLGYEENTCPKCQGKLIRRTDETPQAIAKRLQEYYDKTKPVVDYYRKTGQLLEIDGEPPVPKVTQQILEKLK